jgi:SAM-dependent methyltransferase
VDWPGSLHKTNHIDVYGDLNSVLQIDDSSFDTILSTSVLEHIWQHDVFWREMARLLKPSGRILLGTPFLYQLHEEPFDYFRWTSHGLRRACQENDLTVIDLWPYGGGLDVVADMAIKLVARRSRRIAGGLSAVAEALLRKGPLRRWSDGAAPKIPTGFMLIAEKSSQAA